MLSFIDNLKTKITSSTKLQLQLSTCIIITLLLCYALLNLRLIATEKRLYQLSQTTFQAENNMQMARRYEKDHMSSGDEKYLRRLIDKNAALRSNIYQINAALEHNKLDISFDTATIISAIADYDRIFLEYAEILSDINSSNIISLIEESWLKLEEKNHIYPALQRELLQSQENVYYFFFRKQNQYYDAFIVNVDNIKEQLSEAQHGDNSLNLLAKYRRNVSLMYEKQNLLGLDENSGLRQQLNEKAQFVETQLKVLEDIIPAVVQQKLSRLETVNNVLMVILFLCLILVLTFLTRSLTRIEKQLISSSAKAEASNVAKSAFLANMSHEIRTPLNGIIGMSEILSESKLSIIQKDHLSTILTSSQTLLMLINDILDLSKIESGNLVIADTSTDLREVAYDSLNLVINKALENKVSLALDIDAEIAHRVRVDEHRLRQVLMNLLSNAVKFTRDGEVRVIIKQLQTSENNITLYFAVQDTGIGIEKSQQASILQPFTQEDSSITREFGGTGLGLSISDKLVKLMGGQIMLDSEKGKGSTFYFSLPLSVDIQHAPQIPELTEQQYCLQFHDQQAQQFIAATLDYYALTQVERQDARDDINVIYQYKDKPSFEAFKSELFCEKPQSKLILCINIDQGEIDFSDDIDGLVKMPLAGMKLINSLRYALEHKQERKLQQGKATVTQQLSQPVQENDLQASATEATKSKGKVLVVEDNMVNQKVVSLFLSKANFEVDIANNGQQGVEQFSSDEKYDVILMDCMMPIMDGFNATAAIRALEAQSTRIKTPIIALTASVLDEDIKRCYEVGMDDYLAKPIQRENLISTLNKHIALAGNISQQS